MEQITRIKKWINKPLNHFSVWAVIAIGLLALTFKELSTLVTTSSTNQDKAITIIIFGVFISAVFGFIFFYCIKPFIRKIEKEISHYKSQANTDALTQVFNRRAFKSFFDLEFSLLQRQEKKQIALVMMDLDDFKLVNDTFGHDVGDEVLIGVAKTLKSITRRSDVVARFGGEEFILLLPDTSLVSAITLCEKLRKSVERESMKYTKKSRLHSVTMSVGVTSLTQTKTFEEHLALVDKALYDAKKAGKNKVKATK